MEWVTVHHPELGLTARVTRLAAEHIHQLKGWEIVEATDGEEE